MKVAHFNTHPDGGSAVLMLRLHSALRKTGIESRVYHRRGQLQEPHSRQLDFTRTLLSRMWERIKWRGENWMLREAGNLFSPVQSAAKTVLPATEPTADIYHFHWISRWLDFAGFMASLPAAKPVIFTIHDWGNFTGGCHLYSGCHRFQEDCLPCPLLKAPFDRFVAHWELERKKRSLINRRVFVVGNSQWTTSMAASAAAFKNAVSCRTIHPAINPAEFVRTDKAVAKKILGIPTDRFTLGFGCAALTDSNKNFPAFLEVLAKVSRKQDVEAVVFGDGFRQPVPAPARIHSLGKLASNHLLSLAYSAMDVFVMTSNIETFGQVALEAQACGTPVCGFEVGGLPDAVRHGKTGLLSPLGDIGALTANIMLLAENEDQCQAFSQTGYEWSRANFSLEAAAKSYINLYQEASDAVE